MWDGEYPVFFVARMVTQKIGEGFFFTDLVIRPNENMDGRAVVIFTAREAAEAFRDAEHPEFAVFDVYTPGNLDDYLVAAERAVASHALFLPSEVKPLVYVPLRDLLARVRG